MIFKFSGRKPFSAGQCPTAISTTSMYISIPSNKVLFVLYLVIGIFVFWLRACEAC